MKNIDIAIIGGSGIYDFEEIKLLEEINLETPYGKPSSSIKCFEIEGVNVAFLTRHGKGHALTASEIPYRANIFALKKLSVKKVLSISSIGSLKENIHPEDFVLPDQVIDRTKSRVSTFFEKGIVGHVSFSEPFCEKIRKAIYTVLKNNKYPVYKEGTYVCMEGPAFSTIAESNLYRSWGASVIGMTAIPEAKLAREAEMCYALLAMTTDYDCWKEDEKTVSVEHVMKHMIKNTNTVKSLIVPMVTALNELPDCEHMHAASNAIVTDKSLISKEIKERLGPLYEKYFN